jgi:hypothetical protein
MVIAADSSFPRAFLILYWIIIALALILHPLYI